MNLGGGEIDNGRICNQLSQLLLYWNIGLVFKCVFHNCWLHELD